MPIQCKYDRLSQLGHLLGRQREHRWLRRLRSKKLSVGQDHTQRAEPRLRPRIQQGDRKDQLGIRRATQQRHEDSVGGMGIPFWRGFVDIGREEPDQGQYDQENFEPFAFCGGAALIKRSTFLTLGGFDGRFFLYMEDADLSWRLRLFGYRIAFAPEAQVAHYFSGSTGAREIDARKLYYCHRNLLRAILKNCGTSLGWALRSCLLFTLMMAAGFSILEPRKAVAAAKAVLWNLANLKDTCICRSRIQASRNTSEAEILHKMYPNLRRYQPAERPGLRRMLNVLFEYAQRHRLHKLSHI